MKTIRWEIFKEADLIPPMDKIDFDSHFDAVDWLARNATSLDAGVYSIRLGVIED